MATGSPVVLFQDSIVPSGIKNGSNRTFTLPQSPNPAASLALYLNGQLLTQNLDYSLAGLSITFSSYAPLATDSILASFRYTSTSTTTSTTSPSATTPGAGYPGQGGSYPLLTFTQLYKELTGEFEGLPDLMAARLINRAWKRINDFRLWSWQVISNGQLFVPAVISTGTCSVSANSTKVVMSAAATAAINAVAFGNPPIASSILGQGYQIRIGTSANGLNTPTGPNYTIVAWDGAGNLTIDAPYGQGSAVQTNYQILKCYYAAPFLPITSTGNDGQFARFLSITNLLDGYAITGRQLYFSQQELNQIDPQRGGQGDAYILGFLQTNSLGQPVYEMYPNPVNPATYQAEFVSKGPVLTMTTSLPQVSYALDDAVVFCAKKFAGQWAMANVGRYAGLAGTNWPLYCEWMEREWKTSMLMCVKEDDEIMPSPKPFVYNGGYSFPLGGEFLQSHDISSIVPSL